jgi:ABC-2 type transport system permease protein
MKNKFWYLTKYGLKKKFKSKSFIISNIILFILLVGLLNIDTIISFFGGDFNKEVNVYVLDNTNNNYDSFKDNYEKVKIVLDNNEDKVKISKSEKNKEELEKDIEGTTDIIVELNNDNDNYINASIITENYIDPFIYQSLLQTINNTKYEIALKNSNIDVQELAEISKTVEVNRIILDDSKNTEEENMNAVMGVVFPTIIFPFCMLIILLVQMIGTEINEEKTTRSMEIIISNVSAKVHFFSKMLSNNLFIITQAVLLFVYGAIGFLIRGVVGTGINSDITDEISNTISSLSNSGLFDKLYYIIPVTIILMILSFVAYSLIAGILASMTVNTEDYQHIQTPIMIICFIGYYLAVMSSMFNGSLFIRILSYIPLISCLLSPALLVIGQITIIDVMISLTALLLLIGVLSKYGLKIYKIGILNYSTDKMWSRIFKAAKM